MQHFTNISIIFIYSDWEQCNNSQIQSFTLTESNATFEIQQKKNKSKSNKQKVNDLNTCIIANDKDTHTHTYTSKNKWSLIIDIKQRLTYQDDVMKRWQDERAKAKRVPKFQFSSLKTWINRQHLLVIHWILLANSTADIVIHATDWRTAWRLKIS